MDQSSIASLPRRAPPMASRWRRRTECTLIAGRAIPVGLGHISGRIALVETGAALPPGLPVLLRHPDAGTIRATVVAAAEGGLELALAGDADAAGFALAAIAADMTRAA